MRDRCATVTRVTPGHPPSRGDDRAGHLAEGDAASGGAREYHGVAVLEEAAVLVELDQTALGARLGAGDRAGRVEVAGADVGAVDRGVSELRFIFRLDGLLDRDERFGDRRTAGLPDDNYAAASHLL